MKQTQSNVGDEVPGQQAQEDRRTGDVTLTGANRRYGRAGPDTGRTLGCPHVRILVTNDDGVGAPGIGRSDQGSRALDRRTSSATGGPSHEIVVVAPSSNYSGAGAAVGSVTNGTKIPYVRARVSGAEEVDAYGLDASPALSVIAGALGAVGPKPDLVLSGINHGVNVGRSVLHSGTVGAALTASQVGISALAVSLRAGMPEDWWEIGSRPRHGPHPHVGRRAGRHRAQPERPLAAPPRNPRRLRWARVGGSGLIKAASDGWVSPPNHPEMEGPAAAEAASAVIDDSPAEKGEITLNVGSPFPQGR